LISASAVGFYGSRGDEPLFESSPAGTDLLAQVCVDWEAATASAQRLGVRTAYLRTGIVLGEGGALTSMSAPFKLGLGGPFGSGRQFVPWIHVDDLVAMYLYALDNDVRGAINAVTPDYATSARFSQALGAALGRPAIIPAPGFALHAVLGEFAGTILASQLVIPARAEDGGFVWRHPLLEGAMADALGSSLAPPYGVSVYEATQTVKAPRDEVFAFFSSPQNLERLTPSTLHFTITSCPDAAERGSIISYRLKLHGLPILWDTLISRWQPPDRFVDFQLHGPYALWRHEHIFRESGGTTELVDRVQYILPFAPFGNLAKPLVEADVKQIFAYRRQAIEERFPS
jgi:ligand-binding SRPBCC domain-containing protein